VLQSDLARANEGIRLTLAGLERANHAGISAEHLSALGGETVRESLERSGPLRVANFTPRELEVLRHVVLGLTNPEIADRLGLTTNTVKTYWQSTMRKLQARNRVEAVAAARSIGLV